jgi:hypothetical protein
VLALSVLTVLAAALVAVPLTGAQSASSGRGPAVGELHTVTLVTGDVVKLAVRTTASGP